ncbi:hypothetical protein GCM10023169_12810 [Georgenia halophila]|uniref:YrhK domain-containing protein n=1 Tax=Georgenia halophila TaxID=620889 RepID=A0ABP8KVH2_9MICO
MGKTNEDTDPPAEIRVAPDEEIMISNRYETMSIVNDIFIGVFFVAGSIMFYFSSLQTWATTMFLLGSIDFVLRPVIRLARRTHLERLGRRDGESLDY